MRLGLPGFCFLFVGSAFAPAFATEAWAGDDVSNVATKPVASAGSVLVVVADPAEDATQNSELRAALYDVGRHLGYDAGGTLDVDGVATRESLMTAGVVTTDSAELQRLRKALGVAALARVSKSGDGAVRVTVVSDAGVANRDLKAPGAGVEPLKKALGDLLLPAGAPKTDVEVHSSLSGALTAPETPPDHSPSTRDAWAARSGVRVMYGAMAHITGLELEDVAFTGASPQGTPIAASGTSAGIGGGVGVRVGMMFLTLAEPAESNGTFFAFRLDAGLDTDVFWARKPSGYSYSGSTRNTLRADQALWVVTAPLEIGFGVGAGSFADKLTWHGVIVGASYAPAPEFTMDLRNTSGEFRFNPAGAEISADITHLSAEHDDSEMQIRVTLWGLLPMHDDRPGLLSLGIGAIWY
jgi:hypothetical protein